MGMREAEYIRVANRIKISLALTILRDVLAGKEFGICDESLDDLVTQLRDHEIALFKSYKADD